MEILEAREGGSKRVRKPWIDGEQSQPRAWRLRVLPAEQPGINNQAIRRGLACVTGANCEATHTDGLRWSVRERGSGR